MVSSTISRTSRGVLRISAPIPELPSVANEEGVVHLAVRQPGCLHSPLAGPKALRPRLAAGLPFSRHRSARTCGDCSNHRHQAYQSIAVFIATSLANFLERRL